MTPSQVVWLVMMALLIIAFLLVITGCTSYKYAVTHPDGTKIEEKFKTLSDWNNPERIAFKDVEQAKVPSPGMPRVLEDGAMMMGGAPAGYPFAWNMASGASFGGQQLDNSSPAHVNWAGANRSLAMAAATILGYQGFKSYRHANSNDLNKAVSDNKLKAFEANETTKRAGIEARKQTRLKEIDLAE